MLYLHVCVSFFHELSLRCILAVISLFAFSERDSSTLPSDEKTFLIEEIELQSHAPKHGVPLAFSPVF